LERVYDILCPFFFLNSQRLRPTIHDIITSKIKAHSELVNSSRSSNDQTAQTRGLHSVKGQLESYQLSKQKRQNGMSLSRTLLAVSPVSPVMAPTGKAQAAAKELLDSILEIVVRIFGRLLAAIFVNMI
jgi:exocyst complex component 4